ncbi:MAG: formylglycine-generating enzyme family protein [Kiritimatiellae bacterium]|nr:formylglycine-generating enzyme family protein [Kiritimatiellia bacterium]
MRKILLLSIASALVVTASALSVSVESVVQDPTSRTVTITYTLGDSPAVVTVDIHPEGMSAPAPVRSLSGDVNRKVGGKSAYSVTWYPDKDWKVDAFDVPLEAIVTAWPLTSPPDYMVVDVTVDGDNLRYYTSPETFPWDGGIHNVVCKTEKLVLRRIPAAGKEWLMGSPADESDRCEDGSEDQHAVKLTDDYYMGVFEVTQRQYAHVLRNNKPSQFKSNTSHQRPVECVRYINLRGNEPTYDWPKTGFSVSPDSFMGLLRALTENRITFDLPTEAEWEYACRAGTLTRYNNVGGGTSYADALKVAWNSANAGDETHDVGLLDPNGYGLYDMLGNVREWCRDYWTQDRVTGKPEVQINPSGPETAVEFWENTGDGTVWGKRTLRGMGWFWNEAYCRSARRDDRLGSGDTRNSIGFRVWAPIAETGAQSGLSKAVDSGVTATKQAFGAVAVSDPDSDVEYESAHEANGWIEFLDFRKPLGFFLILR